LANRLTTSSIVRSSYATGRLGGGAWPDVRADTYVGAVLAA